MRTLINVGHFSWGKNSTPGGAAKFSTLLLVPKTGGDLGSYCNLTPKGWGSIRIRILSKCK